MERTLISPFNTNKIVLSSSKVDKFLLNLDDKPLSGSFSIKDNSNLDILILHVSEELNVNFEISENSKVHVAIFCKNPLKTVKISANVGQNSIIEFYYADFAHGVTNGEISVNLNKPNSSCDWHLASLAEGSDQKVFDVSVFHNSSQTYAHLDNYGVVRDTAKLQFSGICHIKKGSGASKAHQNAKIMVFDEASKGIAKPILKIDENDIEASHAAVVGKINDEHIFYLTSRGLSEDMAKRIITLGYLKPILNGFSDESVKEDIEKLIEGGK